MPSVGRTGRRAQSTPVLTESDAYAFFAPTCFNN
jgi:hypothetical protein